MGVVDAQARGDAGAEGLDHHIGPGHEFVEGKAAGLALQIQHDAALATMGIAEPGRNAGLLQADLAHRLATWRFDLDHVGAMVGHHHGQVRTRQEQRQVQHTHAFKFHL